MVPHYLTTDHSHGLGLCWIDLAGHYTEPGSFAVREFSKTTSRSGTKPSHIIGFFINEAESVFKSWLLRWPREQLRKLISCTDEGRRSFLISATVSAKSG